MQSAYLQASIIFVNVLVATQWKPFFECMMNYGTQFFYGCPKGLEVRKANVGVPLWVLFVCLESKYNYQVPHCEQVYIHQCESLDLNTESNCTHPKHRRPAKAT